MNKALSPTKAEEGGTSAGTETPGAGASAAGKPIMAVLYLRQELALNHVTVDAAHLQSGGLLWILVMLNDVPCTAIVDTRAELSGVSPDVVQWASLRKVDCKSPPHHG